MPCAPGTPPKTKKTASSTGEDAVDRVGGLSPDVSQKMGVSARADVVC